LTKLLYEQVQGLEGVLADQIIVTNVDDSLSFGDGAVLDSLEETDQQVCLAQINVDIISDHNL